MDIKITERQSTNKPSVVVANNLKKTRNFIDKNGNVIELPTK